MSKSLCPPCGRPTAPPKRGWRKEPDDKKKVNLQHPKPQQASELHETAKAEAQQSERTAALRNNAGFFSSSSTSPENGDRRSALIIQRLKPRSLHSDVMTATVRFRVNDDGTISGVSAVQSTGDFSIDQQIAAWIQSTSPVPAPPPEANKTITLPISIRYNTHLD